MRLLLLAPPGAGKGTQGTALAAHFDVEHISSGDLLRAELKGGTDLGRRAQAFIDSGDLVPDDVLEELLMDHVNTAAKNGGYILDGFPRTVRQADAAQAIAERLGIGLDAVVYLQVPDKELVRRLLARARGADDSEVTIRHRLEVYAAQTEPLVRRFRERELLHEVDGAQPPAEVTAEIVRVVATARTSA